MDDRAAAGVPEPELARAADKAQTTGHALPTGLGHNAAAMDEERRAEWRARYGASDMAAGIETTDDFAPFTQKNDVFARAFWDGAVKSHDTEAFFKSYRMEAAPRRGEGFNQKDFALRNASWLISDIIADRSAADGRREGFQAPIKADTPVAPTQVAVDDPWPLRPPKSNALQSFSAPICAASLILTSAGSMRAASTCVISRRPTMICLPG